MAVSQHNWRLSGTLGCMPREGHTLDSRSRARSTSLFSNSSLKAASRISSESGLARYACSHATGFMATAIDCSTCEVSQVLQYDLQMMEPQEAVCRCLEREHVCQMAECVQHAESTEL